MDSTTAKSRITAETIQAGGSRWYNTATAFYHVEPAGLFSWCVTRTQKVVGTRTVIGFFDTVENCRQAIEEDAG